jgi:dihydropteroate synthase
MPLKGSMLLTRPLSPLHIRSKEMRFGTRTFVMGIVNITPDSFSGDGVLDVDAAVALALTQVAQGADIIDMGGQSARPGYQPIDEETEWLRILPVLSRLRKESDVIISVDTYSPAVFERALGAGADMLNSIWGLDDRLLDLVKMAKSPVVIMHNKLEAKYANGVVSDVVNQLEQQAQKALAVGLNREQIILDPGIGFAKTPEQNLEVLGALDKLMALGFPTLIGTSRKSTIGKLTGRVVEQRAFGTAASLALSIGAGVDIVRVHDVKEMVDVVKVSDAITRRWRPENWQEAEC